MSSQLFTPFRLRDLVFKNRIFVSPMCMYSSRDGLPTDFHLVHLGARAVGGAACILQEATAVSPEGRISPGDAGIWNDAQTAAYQRITRFIKENGAVPGIQLGHAGRKASRCAPWEGDHAIPAADGGWTPVAPSALPLNAEAPVPRALSLDDIAAVRRQFADAARRSLAAGYEVVEIHAAHGLLHQFLSPLTNRREDAYGGSLENRMRLTLEVAADMREIWPRHLPVFVRISATDWVEGGWDLPQSLELCARLKAAGVDLIDVSSGGLVPHAKIPAGPGYQVAFAAAVRQQAALPVGAVGLITQAFQAEQIVATGQADVVLIARESLRDPNWPLRAARQLGVDLDWPKQYARAKRR